MAGLTVVTGILASMFLQLPVLTEVSINLGKALKNNPFLGKTEIAIASRIRSADILGAYFLDNSRNLMFFLLKIHLHSNFMTSNKIMTETKVVTILVSGKKSEVLLVLFNDKEKCLINAVFPNGENFDAESSDYFAAFVYIRNKYPNYIFLCKGAKKNVYPSGMSRDMGEGVLAYELTLGKRAEFKDMVNIFDYDDENVDCTPQQQQEFFNQWLISIRKSNAK